MSTNIKIIVYCIMVPFTICVFTEVGFHHINQLMKGVVYMGNDISCKIIGIRSVKIRMYDGNVKTLARVMCVPEIRKNHISR